MRMCAASRLVTWLPFDSGNHMTDLAHDLGYPAVSDASAGKVPHAGPKTCHLASVVHFPGYNHMLLLRSMTEEHESITSSSHTHEDKRSPGFEGLDASRDQTLCLQRGRLCSLQRIRPFGLCA